MKIFTRLLLFLGVLVLGLSDRLEAQVAAYTFAQSSSTYTEITGGTVIATATANGASAGGLDDVAYGPFTIPSFTFNGVAYTTIFVSSNGYITFGTAMGLSTYTPISTLTGAQAISAWGRDLSGIFNVGGRTSVYRWETVGSEVVIQWKDIRPVYSSSTVLTYGQSFQIRLNTSNNSIKIVYGGGSYAAGSTAITSTTLPQIGLRGTATTDYNNRTNASTALFTASTAGTVNTAGQNFNTVTSPPGMPSAGLTYTWTPPMPCTTPAPGNTVSTVAAACSGVNFTLSTQNATPGTVVTYQWQSSDDMAFTTPTNLGTAATQITSQTAAKWYRCNVTCSVGPVTVASNPVQVTMDAPTNCYCSAVPTSIDVNGVTNVVLGTLSNPNVSTTTYQNFTTGQTVPNLGQGLTLPISITLQTGYTYMCRVFIDFNQDGDFADSGEMCGSQLSSATNPTTNSFNIVIPSGATLGNTRMRIVATDDDIANNPCYSASFGNVEDYTVNIVAAGCTPPTVSATTVVPNCGSNQYSYTFNVTALGSSASLSIPGASPSTVSSVPTTVTVGPFASGAAATGVTVTATDPLCNVTVAAPSTYTCPQPGWTCALPLVVSSFPYTNSGTTCGAGNDEGVQCAGLYGGGEDFIYQLNITTTGNYVINLSATGGGSYIGWFLKGSAACGTEASCLANATSSSGTTANGTYNFTSAGTYYLIIDTWPSPNCSAYTISITAPSTDAVDYCNLQWPPTATVSLGVNENIFAQCWEPGVTEAAGPGADITAWIGISPVGMNTNPNTWTTWIPATFNVQVGDNDEFTAAIGATLAPGTYYYASRFQRNTGPYTYGGHPAGFWDGTSHISGVLTVNPLANDDPCGAITITPGASCSFTAYSSAGATATTGPPVPDCASYLDNDVWFKVVVPSSGALVFDSNTGTITDSGMAIYASSDNTCTGTFSLIECDDDDSDNGFMARIIQSGLTPGATIFVRFWDYDDAEGTFSICVYDPCTNLVASVPATGSAVREADLECYDGEWTHYYDNNETPVVFSDENILLSLKKGSNNIGKIGDVGFAVQQFGATAGAVNVPKDIIGDPNYVLSPMWYVMRRYWNVNVTAQPGMPTVGVRFYYTTADFNAVDVATPVVTHTDMKFYKINNALPPNPVYDINPVNGHLNIPAAPTFSDNGYWQLNNGPSASVSAWKKGVYGSEHYAEYLIQSFSGGGGGGGGPQGAFPIELLYFTGHAEANSNIIDWATATEKNNQYQIVERSANGVDGWNEIGRKAGAGTSTSPIAYKLEDTAPLILGYYRLRAVDFDGAEQLSEVISIERESDVLAIINAFPVPVERQLILQVNAPVSGDVTISLMDAIGRVVLVQNNGVQRGINELTIDMGALASGMYQITVNNGLTTVTRSIVK